MVAGELVGVQYAAQGYLDMQSGGSGDRAIDRLTSVQLLFAPALPFVFQDKGQNCPCYMAALPDATLSDFVLPPY